MFDNGGINFGDGGRLNGGTVEMADLSLNWMAGRQHNIVTAVSYLLVLTELLTKSIAIGTDSCIGST
jgi:hypothetical protein